MRVVSNEDIRPHVDIGRVIDAYETVLAEYYAGDAVRSPRVDTWSPTSDENQFYRWVRMEGLSQHFGVFVTRVRSDVVYFAEAPDGTRTREMFNTRRGLACGLIWVFDVESGAPLYLVQDGYLQRLRVGAQAALAAREGAVDGASEVGVLGSGGMARAHLAAFAHVLDVESARVYSPTAAHRTEFAREMDERLDLGVRAVDDSETAARGADVVACCTDAIEPVLRGEWLSEGAFVSSVKTSSELDDRAWERIDHLINFSRDPEAMRRHQRSLPSSRPHAFPRKYESYAAGAPEDYRAMPEPKEVETHPAFETPLVQFEDVLGGVAEGRTNDDQIVSYGGPGSGQGIQFAAVAGITAEVGKRHELGHEIPNGWLLQ